MAFGKIDGYHQDYAPDPARKQDIYAFCRQCRKGFKLHVRAMPDSRVRCVCGADGPLGRFDVFQSMDAARDFAKFYTSLVREVKDVLRAADVPIPDSGRLPNQALAAEPTVADELEAQWREAITDLSLVSKHERLSALIEDAFAARHLDPSAAKICEKACRTDMALASDLVREAKRRRKEGAPIRLSFTSFKHLSLLLEERGDFDLALEIAEEAQGLGLKGYEQRIHELRLASGETRLDQD